VKNKISKKGQHCGEHSGDVAVLACQDKEWVTMNKANKSEARNVDVHNYNTRPLWVDPKDQMLQVYLLEWKKGN
jgi:hypothetical protein